MSKWVTLPTKSGSNESKGQLKNMPDGPYLFVGQHLALDGMDLNTALEKYEEHFVTFLPSYTWGKVAYFFNENGVAEKCFYHYDTSD